MTNERRSTKFLTVMIAMALLPAYAEEAAREFALEGVTVTLALSDDWKQVGQNNFGFMLMKTMAGDEKISLVINKQPNSRGIATLKEAYERDFQRLHTNYTLISSTVEQVNGIAVLKMVNENETPGKRIRQQFYVFDFGVASCNVTLTGMQDKGDTYDKEFAAIVGSLRKK